MRDKHHITEERHEGKLSRSVLETSGAGDSLAEFNATTKGKSYRNGKKFKCGHCGFEYDSEALASLRASADINAAINIADLGKSVSLPESPGIACLYRRAIAFV